MPKDSKKNDYNSNDDSASEDIDLAEDTQGEGEEVTELDNLSEDVKDALGLDADGEVKPEIVPVKGKKVAKEVTPVSDWLPSDDATALENIDSLY